MFATRRITKACGTVLLGAAFSLLLMPAAHAGASAPELDTVTDEVSETTTDSPASSLSAKVTGPVQEAVKMVKTTVEETADTVEGTVEDLSGTGSPAAEEPATKTERTSPVGRQDSNIVRGTRAGADAGGPTSVLDGFAGALSAPGDVRISGATLLERPSLIDQIAEGALRAAERFAFPLALALVAGAFLVIQGRVGRKDPKLALAPVDGENYLLFQ